jgi:WD40 repeat protein
MKHEGAVLDLTFNSDSRTLATASQDATVRLWDVSTAALRTTLIGHKGPVSAVAFSPDGRLVASGSHDGTVKFWDVALGQPIGPALVHPHRVRTLYFDSDGTMILTGCEDGTVRQWPCPRFTGNPELMSPWLESLTGLRLNDQGRLEVLDTETWAQRRQFLGRMGGPQRQVQVR